LRQSYKNINQRGTKQRKRRLKALLSKIKGVGLKGRHLFFMDSFLVRSFHDPAHLFFS
jgi:hypothetical protein